MKLLPVRVDMLPGQTLDDYLHTVRTANAMTRAELRRELCSTGATTRFLLVRPHPGMVTRIADLTAVDPARVTEATLAAFDHGRPLTLHDVDHTRRGGLRAALARGWLHAWGTQACPACLADGACWQTAWRLPWVTTCPRHETTLVATCPGCGTAWRRRADVLATDDATAVSCASDTPDGPCPFDATRARSQPATASSVDRQRRTDDAITTRPVDGRDRAQAARTYLANLRSLTTLLLHLAGQPGPHHEEHPWTNDPRLDITTPTGRARRWAIAPPVDAGLRADALDTADAILASRDARSARALLAEWTAAAPAAGGTRWAWIEDHTIVTPSLRRLLEPAVDRTRRVATLAERVRLDLPTRSIPQRLPIALYDQYFAPVLRTRPETGAAYVSLCLMRAVSGAATWGAAAANLGYAPELGTCTARAASARTVIDSDHFRDRLRVVARHLDAGRDYRALERTARAMAADPTWFLVWRERYAPEMSPASLRYAITWLWVNTAHGLLATSPAWPHGFGRAERAAYRAFATRPGPARLAGLMSKAREIAA